MRTISLAIAAFVISIGSAVVSYRHAASLKRETDQLLTDMTAKGWIVCERSEIPPGAEPYPVPPGCESAWKESSGTIVRWNCFESGHEPRGWKRCTDTGLASWGGW